jgi:hypothetical protein
MKLRWLLIGLPVFLFACNLNVSETNMVITEFPEKKEIKTSVIQTEPVILAPDEMFIMNDRIWIFQNKKDTLFDVFDLPDCNYLFSTGMKGQGPNEFIFPTGKTIQADKEGFTILDMNVMKTVTLQTDNSLHTVKSGKIFDQFPVNGFIKLNDSLFCAFADCATGTAGSYEYQLKNLSKEGEIKFSEYPDLTGKKFEGDERCQIYYKYLVANPSERRFAAFYSFFKFFRIYSYEGKLEREIQVKTLPFQSGDVENWEERKLYYGRPFATERYIYALCSANEMQVWDWNGNPIIQYDLDKDFFAFAVSEKYKKVYLVCAEETDSDKIYALDLSHLN